MSQKNQISQNSQNSLYGSVSRVHEVNAMGPYITSLWGEIGGEEALTGRAMHVVDTFEKAVRSRFSDAEIREMTLADMGAYDGHFSVEIERRLPFKKIIAIEPRQRNIEKGQAVRAYLGIQTDCEFRLGDIDSTNEVFDIVFCAGVFHHLSNVDAAMAGLRRICGRAIFIECQCYPDPPANKLLRRLYDWFNERFIEPKDIIYNFLPKSYALSGHKFESGYYHGSTIGNFNLVTLSSPKALCMSMQAHAFEDIEVVSSPADYRAILKSALRDCLEVCIFGVAGQEQDFGPKIDRSAYEYETALIEQMLPNQMLEALELRRGLLAHVTTREFHPRWLANGIIRWCGGTAATILRNIKYRPTDKIAFERAKALIADNKKSDAIIALRRLTDTPNTDWRVMYRSCYLLSKLYAASDSPTQADYFRALCLRANPNFPQAIFDRPLRLPC